MLVGEFFYLSIAEVEYAFEQGVFGNLGEYYGLNLVTFRNWLQVYSGSQERLNAIKSNQGTLAITAKATITDNEKECIVRNYVIGEFAKYKEIKDFNNVGGVTYRFLDTKGLIKCDKDRKWAIYKQCLADELGARKGIKYEPTSKSIADLIVAKGQGTTEKSIAVHRGQKMLISELFDTLIGAEQEITDYI